MYAVINTSGKQFRVEPGTVFVTDRLPGEPGDTVSLDDQHVLLVSKDGKTKVGTPGVEGATVDLEILEHLRGEKVIVFKMKRRKRYRCKKGHRQELTRVSVKDINAD